MLQGLCDMGSGVVPWVWPPGSAARPTIPVPVIPTPGVAIQEVTSEEDAPVPITMATPHGVRRPMAGTPGAPAPQRRRVTLVPQPEPQRVPEPVPQPVPQPEPQQVPQQHEEPQQFRGMPLQDTGVIVAVTDLTDEDSTERNK